MIAAIEYYKMVQEQDGRAPHTIKRAVYVMKNVFAYIGKPVDEVSHADVRSWLLHIDVSAASRQIYLSYLNTFYTIIIESEEFNVIKNPVSAIQRRQKIPATNKQKPMKTVKDVSNFLKTVRHIRDRTMFVVLAKCGLRVSELVCLMMDDYDADAGTLLVDKHTGDARNHKTDIRPGRKNGISTLIPIDAELSHVLNIYLTATRKEKGTPIFERIGGGRMSTDVVRRRFKQWGVDNGFIGKGEQGLTPHWFRHFMSYQLLIDGCNPMVVDYVRGDVAGDIKNHYARQVLPAEKIRSEYIRTVPQFGL